MITVVFGNHKFGKIRPKFLSIIRHFLKFVEDSQVLQVCCNVAHFLQNSDNIFTGFELFGKKFSQKMRCVIFHLWAFERKFRSKVRSRFFFVFRGSFLDIICIFRKCESQTGLLKHNRVLLMFRASNTPSVSPSRK